MSSGEAITFGLVHGAWHGAWCWEYVEAELQAAGHNTIAVDLPIDNPGATFNDHADIVVDALEDKENIVLVGHSRGGNIIPRAAGRLAARQMLFVCGAFHATLTEAQVALGQDAPDSAMPAFKEGILPIGNGLATYDRERGRDIFYHDCDDNTANWALDQLRPQRRATEQRMAEWPDVPSSYIVCNEDRVISPEWSRYAARTWLNGDAIEMPGGHSPFLSRPAHLAAVLLELSE